MPETVRIARKLSNLGLVPVDSSPVATEVVNIDGKQCKVVASRHAMGTLVAISVICSSQQRAEEAIGRAFEEMDRLIDLLNRYDGASAVSALNDHGRLAGPPPELVELIVQSLYHHALSREAFDISIAPLVNLYRERLEGAATQEPTKTELVEALELVGSQNIKLSQQRIGFKKPGMGITLDGIAKGFIVDVIAGVLRKHGIKNFLINAGGDIRTAGVKERRQPWTIAVEDPSKQGLFPDTIELRDAAVATSGSYEIHFDREKLFHHIVSSRTGKSPTRNVSVSIVAPSTMEADALATSVFVMEPHEGIAFIDALPGRECLIIDPQGARSASRGWRSAIH
jgi:thiamine biosynthesis lipoprotein